MSVLTVDGTKKSCKGIVAQLVDIMGKVAVGSTVDAVVPDLVNRNEVVEWARRKGYQVVSEVSRNNVYIISILKTH